MNGTVIRVMAAGALALALTGCRTINGKTVVYPVKDNNGKRLDQSPGPLTVPTPVKSGGAGSEQVQQVGPGQQGVVNVPPQQPQMAIASHVLEKVRVLVRPHAAGQDGEQVATLLRNGLEGSLAAAGYKVVHDGPAEIYADLAVTCVPLNARGTRIVYKGDADVSVTRSPEFNTITHQFNLDRVARNRFDVQGLPGRGDGDALKSVADRMTVSVSPWLAEACLKVGGRAEVCELTIANAWGLSPHSDFPSRFCREVLALGGVYDCQVDATDNVNRTVRARIVYDRDRFPDGIVNRLYTVPALNTHR